MFNPKDKIFIKKIFDRSEEFGGKTINSFFCYCKRFLKSVTMIIISIIVAIFAFLVGGFLLRNKNKTYSV